MHTTLPLSVNLNWLSIAGCRLAKKIVQIYVLHQYNGTTLKLIICVAISILLKNKM